MLVHVWVGDTCVCIYEHTGLTCAWTRRYVNSQFVNDLILGQRFVSMIQVAQTVGYQA